MRLRGVFVPDPCSARCDVLADHREVPGSPEYLSMPDDNGAAARELYETALFRLRAEAHHVADAEIEVEYHSGRVVARSLTTEAASPRA